MTYSKPVLLSNRTAPEASAESYYDSNDADRFYGRIWGGEAIHIGLYRDEEISIRQARDLTVAAMAERIEGLGRQAQIYDLGAGYGGAARYLAKRFGCDVVCINLSRIQNRRNRLLNFERGLDENIRVLYGSFEHIPAGDASVDVIWSQDAFMHSGRRHKVVAEIARVLKPGGHVVFTDPMQADSCPRFALRAVYERLGLDSLASPGWYRAAFAALGMEENEWCDMSGELRTHYARVGASVRRRFDELARCISRGFLNRMLAGLDNWVDAADAGHLRWGIFHFRKPPRR